MTQSRKPLNPWLVSYISQNYSSKSRYEIDSYLINLGHNPAEIDIAWYQLQSPFLKAKPPSPIRSKIISKPFFVFTIIGILSLILLIVWLKPQLGYYNYSDPDEAVNKTAVGENIGIFTKSPKGLEFDVEKRASYIPSDTSFLSCENKINNLRECFWRRTQNSTGGVIVRFPKSKGLSPDNGTHWMVHIVSKQGNILIGDIEDIIQYLS